MSFTKFTADYLFDGIELLKGMVLITNSEGVVQDVVSTQSAGDDIQQFRGILSPGLINCHCHLELSHLKDVIPPHTGLIEFLVSVVQKRGFPPEVIASAIDKAEIEMYQNGIVAVGDICNTADAVAAKSKSEIYWNSFIEVLSFTDDHAREQVSRYGEVLAEHVANLPGDFKNTLTPHAPYTISPLTFQLINEATAGHIISIHNQEHPAEDELYKTGKGDYLKLFQIFGFDRSPFPVTGKSSIQSVLPYFNNEQKIFLVHNTYMPTEDIVFANGYARENDLQLVYCLCVNANRYIENAMPPVERFLANDCHVVLGTDSYSSNWQLSIASEIGTVLRSSAFLDVPREKALATVMKWATMNGAVALGIEKMYGSFEKGKKPGITLIDTEGWTSRRLG